MTILKPIVSATSKRLLNSATSRSNKLQFEKRRIYEKLTLNSYLNVCVDVGQVDRAYKTLLKNFGTKRNPLVDVTHYNAVLKGLARSKHLKPMVEIRMHMIKNDVEPNAESYAYILLGYTDKYRTSVGSIVPRLLTDMKEKGIDARLLFSSTYLNPNERNSIREMLRTYDPTYDDNFCDIPISYNCKLLKDFDKVEQVSSEFNGIKTPDHLILSLKHQRSLESKSSLPIKSIISQESSLSIEYQRAWNKHVSLWRTVLSDVLDQRFQELETQCSEENKIHLYPYMCSIERELLLEMLIDEIENNATSSSFSFSTHNLHLQLGNRIMTKYLKAKAEADGSEREKLLVFKDYLKDYCTNSNLMSKLNPREFIQIKAAQTKNYAIYKDRITPVDQWPHHVVAAVGRFFYGILLKEIKFDPQIVKNPRREIKDGNLVNAFYTAYFQMNSSHKIKEEFRAHDEFERFQQKATVHKVKFDYSYLPCSTPPMPWLSHGFGGYISNRSELIRTSNPFAEKSLVIWHNIDNQKLYPSLDSLNAIGICPWIVNRRILDLVIEVFKNGGNTDLNIPLSESKMLDSSPTLKDNASKADRILFQKDKRKYDQKRREMYSLWRDCLYRLTIANSFRDRTFWFPHNMDFRGRTYPIPPHFNHLGSDLARSLLLFARGRPLGERGLDWLKLHLINLVGSMKSASLKERLEYANSILHTEIMDSADKPWKGNRWWQQNENPWQVLACCKEIVKAVRSRDPTKYICHFPIHQDGSCNGLQHYAALGRDPGGAMAVNLIPCERPQDVYSRIVDLVEGMRKEDAEKGDKTAIMLDGFVQRKVIKQTVMTTVYGVTRYGARQQIARQLTAKGYNEREVWQGASYLTAKTFESIGQMFNKSRMIQDWLIDCAYTIASKYNQPVSWETPLGFPVKQPYTVPSLVGSNRLMSAAIVSEKRVAVDPLARVNASKQRSAFPPNYIHSLDSSHMMLTSLYCQRKGITFVSVHDCYWTHPSTVDQMNEICRQQFVALHSEQLLKDLSDQFCARFNYEIASVDLAENKRQRGKGNKLNQQHQQPLLQEHSQEELAKRHVAVASAASLPELESDDLSAYLAKESRLVSAEDLIADYQNDDDSIDELVQPHCEERKPGDSDVIKSLAKDFRNAKEQSRLRDRDTFKRVPRTGDLDLREVLKSTYFFS